MSASGATVRVPAEEKEQSEPNQAWSRWHRCECGMVQARLLFWMSAAVVFIVWFALVLLVPPALQPLAPAVLGASLSLVAALVIVVSYLLLSKHRRHPNELLVHVALCEVGLAILMLVHVLVYCVSMSQSSHVSTDSSARPASCYPTSLASCCVLNAMQMFLLFASVGWFGAAIFHLFVSVTNPFAHYRTQLKCYHTIVWTASVAISLVMPFVVFSQRMQDSYGLTAVEMCRMVNLVFPMLPTASSLQEQLQLYEQWQALNLAYWGVLFGAIIFTVVTAQVILALGWWRSNSGTIIALRTRRRMMKRMTIYVHMLNASWVVILIVYFVYRSNSKALKYLAVTPGGVSTEDVYDALNEGEDETMKLNFLTAFVRYLLTAKGYFACVVWISVITRCDRMKHTQRLQQAVDNNSFSDIGTQHLSSSSLNSLESVAIHRENAAQPALHPTAPATSQSADTVSCDWATQNNETLQREIIYYTVSGITKAILKSARNGSGRLTAQELMVGADNDSLLANNSIISNVQQLPPPRSPRTVCKPSEIPVSTSLGLQDYAHRGSRAARMISTQQRPSTTQHSGLPTRFSLYPVSHVPYELFERDIELQSNRSSSTLGISPIFAGIRRTASALSRPSNIDDPKPTVFIDYAPSEFRSIREAFGLTDEMYLASFRSTAKERISAGSSGAFMFFSGDNALIVKSMKEKECRKLVRMVPQYAAYIRRNPHSRIIRFFGCHRIRLYGRNFYFVVMANVLHSPNHAATISEKYDLKGSWIDRRARRPLPGELVTCSECNAQFPFQEGSEATESPFHVHRPDIILKDLDLTRQLHLAPQLSHALYRQLVLDCEFLNSMGIMDYSLLVGIHRCHRREPWLRSAAGAEAQTNPTLARESSERSIHLAPIGEDSHVSDEVYFVGIIDILQEWDLEKQLEKVGKALIGKSPTGISAIAPDAYCDRFKKRVRELLQINELCEETRRPISECEPDPEQQSPR